MRPVPTTSHSLSTESNQVLQVLSLLLLQHRLLLLSFLEVTPPRRFFIPAFIPAVSVEKKKFSEFVVTNEEEIIYSAEATNEVKNMKHKEIFIITVMFQ